MEQKRSVRERVAKPATNIEVRKQGDLTFYYGIEQGTQEWLDLRADRVTCSNAQKLCEHGVEYAIEINRQHAARLTPNGNQYAERGHVLEAEIKELVEEAFASADTEPITCSFITNEKYPLAGYSPDWIIVDKKTKEFIAPVEIKCFNDVTEQNGKKIQKNKHALCCEDPRNIPLDNRMQFEMEMLMTNTEQLMVLLYNPDADTDNDVPKLKMHVYTPEVRHRIGADGEEEEYYAYRERLEELLSKMK